MCGVCWLWSLPGRFTIHCIFKAFSFRKLTVEICTAKVFSGMGLIPLAAFALFSGPREQKQLGFAGGVFLPQVLMEEVAPEWVSFSAPHAGAWCSAVLTRLVLHHWLVPAGATGVIVGVLAVHVHRPGCSPIKPGSVFIRCSRTSFPCGSPLRSIQRGKKGASSGVGVQVMISVSWSRP